MLLIPALIALVRGWWQHRHDRTVEVYRALCPLCFHPEDDPDREEALARVGHHIIVEHSLIGVGEREPI
ncbi:hypothetical protein [Glutamicibacter sp. V16R2B1]|uniref:hypothetical protein n=1 Tax=Glutamicibacter sp. V16R2B1 TaxID=2036207 RepID=UPI0010FD8762|nr:hypothetical protein [Glutamicibacter sp. V16R2B1]MCK9901246.1 hypothetical protein [Frankia sp. Cpl3]TLK46880.1 hypothetical protein FDN03_16090 [Glutamicibacter sp. V16R2B1]